jgi:nucleolar protein 12
VQAPPKSRYQERIQQDNDEELSELDEEEDAESEDDSDAATDEDNSEDDAEEEVSMDSDTPSEDEASESEAKLANLSESILNGAQEKATKKRKRGDKEEVEDTYMRKLAREELKEEEQRQKKRKTDKARAEAGDEGEDDNDEASETQQQAEENFTIPKHETLAETGDKDAQEVEKAGRTVFLGNVSTECINSKSSEKALKKHLESFIADLADNNPPHKVESIRFRSTAFDNSLPKRAAFAKKEIMDSTTRSTNAYAVYTTKVAAREAVKKLNGSVFLKRHLHVDSVAHPTKIDHRRCVFVGNLPFVDDESQTPTAEGEVKKNKKPASDVEEGLWTHFAKAGKIESVRVVRDAATRVGKGFAYVQFYDENGVEAALQYNEQKYPPMLPRKLRVTRCRAEKKNKKDKPRVALPTKDRKVGANGKAGYVAKMSDEQKSMQGRARSMLGKVAKAQSKEGFVFEGHRAKEGQGKTGLKFKGSGGKKKGPNGRKSRSSAWKSKK